MVYSATVDEAKISPFRSEENEEEGGDTFWMRLFTSGWDNIFRGAEEGECRKPNKEEKSGHLGF